jgi:hypothetical protein
MPTKKSAGSADWSDPDDEPELTEDMLRTADTFDGDRFVRRGHGSAGGLISIRVEID